MQFGAENRQHAFLEMREGSDDGDEDCDNRIAHASQCAKSRGRRVVFLDSCCAHECEHCFVPI